MAKINDLEVTSTEFQKRLAFNPLSESKNPDLYKRTILTGIITEKILAIEAERNPEIAESVKVISNQYLKEAMIERIRIDSVESKIEIPEEEVYQRYINSLKQIRLKYAAFRTKEEAEYVSAQIDAGTNFDDAIQHYMKHNGWSNLPVPEKTITFGSEPEPLETPIFTMTKMEVSKPIEALDEYYIIKIVDISFTRNPAPEEFNNQKPGIENQLFKEHSQRLYKKFYQKQILPRLAKVNKVHLDQFLDRLISNYFDQIKNSTTEMGQLPQNIESHLLAKSTNPEIIEFRDGSIWRADELLLHLKNGPFIFNFSNDDMFKTSFKNNVRLLIEFEAIYRFALNKGYDKNKSVRNEFQMWNSGLLSSALRSEMNRADNGKIGSGEYSTREEFDRYLVEISDKYRIQINKALYDQAIVPNLNVLVRKAHFQNRVAAPMVESVSDLKTWQHKIQHILLENGIEI